MIDTCVLKVKQLSRKAVIPHYAHRGDMCFDIHVIVDKNNKPTYLSSSSFRNDDYVKLNRNYVVIAPSETVLFHTGLILETDDGYGLKVHIRSSVGIKKQLILSNCTGIIDTSTYRGELLIALTNIGAENQFVYDGDKVAQGEVVPVIGVEIVKTNKLSKTERGSKGIGSTGER